MQGKRWRGVWISIAVCTAAWGANDPQQQQGLAFAAVPSLSFSSGEGWEYGGKIFLYQYGSGTPRPYRWHLLLNGARSTERKKDYYAFLDIPHLWGTGTRLSLRVEYKDFGLDEFYGLGNLPEYHQAFTSPGDPDFLSREYYNYKHRWTAGYINAQFPVFAGRLRFLAGLAGLRTSVGAYPLPNRFAAASPFGTAGGWSSYARIGLVRDTRDAEAAPASGSWSDLLLEKSARVLASDYDYNRITVTDRRYFRLLPRLVFAQRLLIEHMSGHPPFYEMTVLSGSWQRFEGLGSNQSMRGVPRLLFAGTTKLLGNFELRCRLLDRRILHQDLTFYGHLFLDGGKVWLRGDPATLDHLHFSQGAGLHVQWKTDLIGALDIGRSQYKDFAIYLTFGNLF